jgi:hypothetical protein
MRAPGAARLFRPRTARTGARLASPPSQKDPSSSSCAPHAPRRFMVGASPPPKTRFTNHDRLSGCLVLYSLTTGGQQRLLLSAAVLPLSPCPLSLSLAGWLYPLPVPGTAFAPSLSLLPLPALNPPRRVAHGQPGSPRFLFAVSGNRVRAAATASGRATENPSTNQNYYLTAWRTGARLPRRVPSCVLHCTYLPSVRFEAVGARGGRAASEPPGAPAAGGDREKLPGRCR